MSSSSSDKNGMIFDTMIIAGKVLGSLMLLSTLNMVYKY